MAVVSFWLAAVLPLVGQQDASGSVRVAVVNVPAVSEKYLKTTDLETEFEKLRQTFNQQREALQSRIDRTAQSLQEELKPGTEEHWERRKQLAMLDAELQVFVESEGQKIESRIASSLRAIFDDILAATREIALERGIDIVLATDQLPKNVPDSSTQARQQIMLQKVLHWSPRVDLTDDVITRVNAKYKAPSSSAPPVGSARPVGGAETPASRSTIGARFCASGERWGTDAWVPRPFR